MKLEDLSDKDLAKIASNIVKENKRRANYKAAATAIIAILKKYKISINEIPELGLEKRSSAVGKKKLIPTQAKHRGTKIKPSKKADKRLKVAHKYKNPTGSEKWSGRGRAPQWVKAVLEKNNISIAQFKTDRRYKT